MSEYRRGIESYPSQAKIYDRTPKPIVVFIIDLLNDDNVVDTVRLDFAKFEDRKRMGELTNWAIGHKHSIETMALSDAYGE